MVVKAIERRMGDCQEATVIDMHKKKSVKGKPVGLNTIKLLQVAAQAFNMSSQETMRIAETLYLRGFTTYPRTESTSFSENFNFKEILQAHTSHSDWGEYARKLLNKGYNKPKKGADAGDHPPITPVRSANRGELSDREWRVYSYITRSFLGCISRDAIYDAVAVMFETGGEQFTLKGKVLLDPGFLEIMHW
jgi:DNA topoisomerase-3